MQSHRYFKTPLLKKKELLLAFDELDQVLSSAISLINRHTDYAHDCLLNYYVEIASGTARFKNYYVKKSTRNEEKVENGFRPDDRQFLLDSHSMLYAADDVLKIGFNR